jgi:hypothetical protein
MHNDGKQVVETAIEARGGLLGRPVLLVLVVSCVLAVAALIVTYSGAQKKPFEERNSQTRSIQ